MTEPCSLDQKNSPPGRAPGQGRFLVAMVVSSSHFPSFSYTLQAMIPAVFSTKLGNTTRVATRQDTSNTVYCAFD